MPRVVPLGAAIVPILTGETIDATEALRIGLVHRVVSGADLIPTAEGIAGKIMSRGQTAVRCAKQVIERGLDLTLEQGLEMESRLFTAVLDTEDARAGIRAYLDSKNS
jgi:enoyl-CoA hydratase/carnithine racemase